MKLFPPRRVNVYGIALLVIAVLGGVLWSRREPSYNGTGLSEWLERARDFSDTESEAAHAVRQIGPRAIPKLVRMLQRKEPKWKVKVNEWLRKSDWVEKLAFEDRSVRAQEDALRGFYILGAAAKPAMPSLTAMLNDAEDGRLAVRALRAIGVETAPLLIKAHESTNQQTRADAAFALTSFQTNVPGLSEQMWALRNDTNEYVAMAAIHWTLIHGSPTGRVQVLRDALNDGRRAPVGAALTGLKISGEAWTNVLPELVQLMNAPNWQMRLRITNALLRLDPVIAASVGIQTSFWSTFTNRSAASGRRGGRRGPGGRGGP